MISSIFGKFLLKEEEKTEAESSAKQKFSEVRAEDSGLSWHPGGSRANRTAPGHFLPWPAPGSRRPLAHVTLGCAGHVTLAERGGGTLEALGLPLDRCPHPGKQSQALAMRLDGVFRTR